MLIESQDFAPIAAMQAAADWSALGRLLAESARRLEQAGAQGLLICTNTMHKLYDEVQAAIGIPVLHIGDVTARKLIGDGIGRAGLLGTRFTMAESFYRERIEAHGIAVDVPDQAMAAEIDRIIFEELVRGTVSRVSQRTLKTCITSLAQARNQAVILGCTELVMLVDPVANILPIYDTTALHSAAAVDWILSADSGSGTTSYD